MNSLSHFIRSKIWKREIISTCHRKLILICFLIGLTYFPTWLYCIKENLLDGHSAVLINLGLLYLGVNKLWEKRFSLKKMAPEVDDRFLGYTFLIAGLGSLFLFRDSITLQAISLMLAASGAFLSTYGIIFFVRFPLCFLMIIASIYPGYHFISNKVWTFFAGPYFLEDIMANLGGIALRLLNYPAVSEGRFIFLSNNGVEVLRGCSGFDMAFEVACFSLILGLTLNQVWPRIILVTTMGVLLALAFNIPRIILLTLAVVYWGETSFDFWHGPWGGQIFSITMFTVYYYAAMSISRGKPLPSESKSELKA